VERPLQVRERREEGGRLPAGGPAAASRETGTTRGPAISSVNGTRFFLHGIRRSDFAISRHVPYRSLSRFFGS